MLNRLALAVLAVLLLGAGPSARSQNCATYGCVHVTGSGLFVQDMRAGVTGLYTDECGYFKGGLQRPGQPFSTIHTSAYKCIGATGDGIHWGPTWDQNQSYPDGTLIFGWWSPHYTSKGSVTIHA